VTASKHWYERVTAFVPVQNKPIFEHELHFDFPMPSGKKQSSVVSVAVYDAMKADWGTQDLIHNQCSNR